MKNVDTLIYEILAEEILIEDVLDAMLQLDDPIGRMKGLIKGFDKVVFSNPQFGEAYRNRGMAKLKLSEILPAFENPGAITLDAIHDLQTSSGLPLRNDRFI